MKISLLFILVITGLLSCESATKVEEPKVEAMPITGTWQLLTGTLIENGDTVVTDYTKNISFIKIINATHFAFLQHDLSKGKDSSAVYASGGGRYTLSDSLYTEQLEYCSARDWEGNDFAFIINLKNDTLTQSGVEKVAGGNVNRINIEKYIRVNK